MTSIVLELQQNALNGETSVTDLLRKALVVAKKLRIEEFKEWLTQELDGYDTNSKVPKYRKMEGIPKAVNPYHGWQPIYFESTETLEALSFRDNSQRVAEIESLLLSYSNEADSLQMPYSSEQEQMICDAIGKRTQITLMISSTCLVRIIDAVRNIVLNWALQLEEDGVLGEGMTFSENEKTVAEQHTYNVTHFHADVTGSQIQQSSPNAQQSQTLENFSTTNINNFISKLKDELKNIKIDEDTSKELNVEIATVDIQMSSPKPKNGIIKESLSSIRTILEGASGSVAGQLLIELGKLI